MTDIERIRSARSKLEQDIRTATEKALSEFLVATGGHPNSIEIDLLPVERLGYHIDGHVVNKVVATLNL